MASNIWETKEWAALKVGRFLHRRALLNVLLLLTISKCIIFISCLQHHTTVIAATHLRELMQVRVQRVVRTRALSSPKERVA